MSYLAHPCQEMSGRIENLFGKQDRLFKQRGPANPGLEKITTYGDGVLGARRVRAAWEWLARNDTAKCSMLKVEPRSICLIYKI